MLNYFPAKSEIDYRQCYKFKRNIELGWKFRYQGGAPFTPFDQTASQRNYLTTGVGTLDYTRFNNNRLAAFNAMDIRIDKKWNFKNWALDVFIDVTNPTSESPR